MKKLMRVLVGLLAFVMALFMCTSSGSAQTSQLAFVTSGTDGNGLFTYTFSKGDIPGFVFGWGTIGGDNFILQSHDVLSVSSPAGWASSIDSTGRVKWQLTNGVFFLDSASLTFSIQSALTTAVMYTETSLASTNYPQGAIIGGVYTSPDHNPYYDPDCIACTQVFAIQRFSYLGPQAIPEPSPLALLSVAGTIGMLWFRKRRLGTG